MKLLSPFGNKYGQSKVFTIQCENVNTVEDVKDSKIRRILKRNGLKKQKNEESNGLTVKLKDLLKYYYIDEE